MSRWAKSWTRAGTRRRQGTHGGWAAGWALCRRWTRALYVTACGGVQEDNVPLWHHALVEIGTPTPKRYFYTLKGDASGASTSRTATGSIDAPASATLCESSSRAGCNRRVEAGSGGLRWMEGGGGDTWNV